ncbi:MAG TPA: hypothetical protein VHA35_23060 [Dongiaceae bacterium]|jgi:hypothetical protein|nr:hypothetical protein [Dongiaceae bacterium]
MHKPIVRRVGLVVLIAGGIGLVAILGAILLPMEASETGARAVRSARAELGASFHYHLDGLSVFWKSGVKHVEATVAAWNGIAVIDLPVAWDE